MINPNAQSVDYLEFVCDECNTKFHHATKISHDAPTTTDAQKYDIRNWIIMRIHLQCPKCGSQDSFKLSLREDLAESIN